MSHVRLAVVENGLPADYLVLLADEDAAGQLAEWLNLDEQAFFGRASKNEVRHFFFPRGEGGLFVRILKAEKNADMAAEDARLAGSELLTSLHSYKVENLLVRNLCAENRALAFAEGMALASFQFLKYFSEKEKKEKPLREIRFERESVNEADVADLNIILQAVFLTRALVNEPHSSLDTPALTAEVVAAGKKHGFKVEVFGKEKLESLKMGGLLAVNQASEIPPRFCILEHKPKGAKNKAPVVLVGKGVVYDTGGLSLKPSEGMDFMKCDMAGAATVLGTFIAATNLKLPVHLIGLLPITDNKIGSRSIVPGDVITMHSGTTVEVVNTDAEGRLILADALHFAKKYKPELVLDFATLTGSAVRAFGSQAICYMGTASEEVKKALELSGWATYERLVELPLWKEYGEELKSNIADMKNLGSSTAGMITAGKFLEHFVDYPWLHMDIAGPAYLRSASGYRTKEGTGVGVRLTIDFLKRNYS